MKNCFNYLMYNLLSLLFFCLFMISFQGNAMAPKQDFYEIKIYYLKEKAQEARVESFLKNAYLPALYRAGIDKVGVFKPVESDTAAGKRIYVLIPFKSADQFVKLDEKLEKDQRFAAAGKEYLNAPHNNPPYERIESILLKAFEDMPRMEVPDLSSAPGERVYELRSYEGPTEKRYQNKVEMFNEGGEVRLFDRLGFNAVFYGEVLSGCRMPNLMYMTTFENMASRDEHWDTFRNDPVWKELSSMSKYQNNVSKSDIFLLHPTEYSDI